MTSSLLHLISAFILHFPTVLENGSLPFTFITTCEKSWSECVWLAQVTQQASLEGWGFEAMSLRLQTILSTILCWPSHSHFSRFDSNVWGPIFDWPPKHVTCSPVTQLGLPRDVYFVNWGPHMEIIQNHSKCMDMFCIDTVYNPSQGTDPSIVSDVPTCNHKDHLKRTVARGCLLGVSMNIQLIL